VKFTKFFTILTLAAIVSLLLVAIPASPALAVYDYEITLDPEEGEIGDTIDIDGTDWPPTTVEDTTEYPSYVDIYFSIQEADTSDKIDTEVKTYQRVKTGYEVETDGDFSTSFKVPTRLSTGTNDEDVHGGTYYVYVTTGKPTTTKTIRAVAEFTVIAGQITLSPVKGVVGTEVKITGKYFGEREDITVTCDDEDVDIKSGDETTTSAGAITTYILIPEFAAGEHTIAVEDESGHIAEATFTVEPKIAVGATEGEAGDDVTVTGTGFGEGVGVEISLDGTVVGSGDTDEYGSFNTSFEVPDIEEGSYGLTVEDDDGNEGTGAFIVLIATEVSINPVTTQASAGHVGTDITINGVGFEPNTDVLITYATAPTVVATTTTDADGAFTAIFKAPKSTSGKHTITASDGVNSLTMDFYMESTPPSVPQLLLPQVDVKAESPVYFDWKDVTDDSPPVIYSLQVAIDDDFTSASIVLEKGNLTNSEYTVTEAEKLEPRKKETPYYWRVKATDSASNESAWSASRSFYTGGGLGGITLPSWIWYVWVALAAVIAGFTGYWMGKRTGTRY